MKKYIILASILILSSLLGCANQANPQNPQSSEQVQASSDIGVSAGVEHEVSTDSKKTSQLDCSNPGVYEIEDNVIYTVDINGDGIIEHVSITNTTNETETTIGGVQATITSCGDTYLTINDVEYEETGMELFKNAYIIRKDSGNVGIVIYGDWMSDNYKINIYGFDGIEAVVKEDYYSKLISIEQNSLSLSSTLFMLGTWNETTNYIINDDFSLSESDEFSKIESVSTNDHLVTKIDITVQMLDNGVYSDTLITAGSKIYPTNTGYIDDTRCLIFILEDGSIGRLVAEYIDNVFYINGINEFDVFESIPYLHAGA